MLANALFVVALLALVGTTVLCAGFAMTRAAIARTAQGYVGSGLTLAVSALRTTIATRIASGAMGPRAIGSPAPLPTIAPACASGPECRFRVAAQMTLTNTRDVAASTASPQACDAASTDCAIDLESDPHVDEGRLAARIVVDVLAPDGTVLVQRAQTVLMRTFALPPYVTVDGARDATFDGLRSGASDGDDGGTLTPLSPCATFSPGAATSSSDTSVRVAYHNASSGACFDGSRFQTQPWSNANGDASGWSP